MKRVRVDWNYSSRYVNIYLDGHGEKLFDAWAESCLDSDFDALSEWIMDRVAEEAEIYIEDIEEIL